MPQPQFLFEIFLFQGRCTGARQYSKQRIVAFVLLTKAVEKKTAPYWAGTEGTLNIDLNREKI